MKLAVPALSLPGVAENLECRLRRSPSSELKVLGQLEQEINPTVPDWPLIGSWICRNTDYALDCA